jgi:hypothetical protein
MFKIRAHPVVKLIGIAVPEIIPDLHGNLAE